MNRTDEKLEDHLQRNQIILLNAPRFRVTRERGREGDKRAVAEAGDINSLP